MIFKDFVYTDFKANFEVDQTNYYSNSSLYDEYEINNCHFKGYSNENDYNINIFNSDKVEHEVSYELIIHYDNNKYHISHDDCILTIYNETHTKVITINDENTYFEENESFILIKLYQQNILPKTSHNFTFIKSIQTYTKYPSMKVIISNHSISRIYSEYFVAIHGFIEHPVISNHTYELHYYFERNNQHQQYNIFNSEYINIHPNSSFSHYIRLDNKLNNKSFSISFVFIDQHQHIYSSETHYNFTLNKSLNIKRKLHAGDQEPNPFTATYNKIIPILFATVSSLISIFFA